MFDIALRNLKDQVVHPISRILPSSVSPNTLTLLAFTAGLACCYTSALPSHPGYALALWLTNRLLDCLDGSVARHRNAATETGGFLDLLSDFIIYSLLPISVAWGQDRQLANLDSAGQGSIDWRAIAVLEASFHINNFVLFYVAAVASKKGAKELTSVSMRPALVEGFESGCLFTAMLLWPRYISGLSWIMSAGVSIGVVQRILVLLPILGRVDGENRSKQ